jgi:hypothetical protein
MGKNGKYNGNGKSHKITALVKAGNEWSMKIFFVLSQCY